LGIDIGTAVNLLLAQSVHEGGLPFHPTAVAPFEQSVLDAAAETPVDANDLAKMDTALEAMTQYCAVPKVLPSIRRLVLTETNHFAQTPACMHCSALREALS
jgi:antitoxin component of RelBE/YafQ-DinJ toxin-antitoxin module